MGLASLRVVHRQKAGEFAVKGSEAAGFALSIPGALALDTCQRQLFIFHAELAELVLPPSVNVYSGIDAYRFLLRVSTGLESQVKGETDVFGQLKQAWATYESQSEFVSMAPYAAALKPWMQKLFEDTKEIRARYLQNVGGESYGSLVRMLLKRHDIQVTQPLLLVGAGHIARSISPWLVENPLWILNRTPESTQVLIDELTARGGPVNLKTVAPSEEARAWREAAHVIVCIPMDVAADAERIRWFEEGYGANRSVIHLGGMRREAGLWSTLPAFHALDDLFALQSTQNAKRSEQFARADHACDEKAMLRSLGGSASLPHGWEDLAAFAYA